MDFKGTLCPIFVAWHKLKIDPSRFKTSVDRRLLSLKLKNVKSERENGEKLYVKLQSENSEAQSEGTGAEVSQTVSEHRNHKQQSDM